MLPGFTSHAGAVTTTARLNVRARGAGIDSPIAMKVEPGTTLRVVGIGIGQNVHGNSTWFAGEGDTYFWSGGCSSFMSSMATPASSDGALRVTRRPDGTIRPLNDEQIRKVFGTFEYQEGMGGRMKIAQSWVDSNITQLKTPILKLQGFPQLQLHIKAVAAFEAVFNAIESAGLQHVILTCGGTYVPRHKTWNPNRGLSSHSWGVAIDLNVAWNGYGVAPAALGKHGSVRELVPFFEAEGFAWGGHFSSPDEDGMHFELARLDL